MLQRVNLVLVRQLHFSLKAYMHYIKGSRTSFGQTKYSGGIILCLCIGCKAADYSCKAWRNLAPLRSHLLAFPNHTVNIGPLVVRLVHVGPGLPCPV